MPESVDQEIRTLQSIFWSERDPDGLAFASLADAFRRNGQVREALDLLTDGMSRHPDFATGHVVAARLYHDQGMDSEAELAARRVLDLDPENLVALSTLTSVLAARGDTGEAARHKTALMAVDPDSDEARTVASVDVEVAEGVDVARDAERAADPAGSDVVDAAEERPPPVPVEPEGGDLDISGLDMSGFSIEEPTTDEQLTGEDETVGDDAPELIPETMYRSGDPASLLDDLTLEQSGAGDADVEDAGLERVTGDPEEDLFPGPEAQFPDLDAVSSDETLEESTEVTDFGGGFADLDGTLEVTGPAPAGPEDEIVDLGALAPDDPEETLEMAALAPDDMLETSAAHAVDLDDLAPDALEQDPVDLSTLAPDGPEDAAVDLSALAPDEPDDDAVDLAALAPDEPEDDAVDLSALAPDGPEDEAVDLAALAPDEPEPTMEVSALAPDALEQDPVDLGSLAPDGPADDAVDLAALAPDEPEEATVDLAALAPDDPEETMEVSALAPEETPEPDEVPEDVVDLSALAPEAPIEELAAALDAADEADAGSGDGEESTEPVFTRTLADLYVKQGFTDKALEVLRYLQKKNPDADDLAQRIDALERGETPTTPLAPVPGPAGEASAGEPARAAPEEPTARAGADLPATAVGDEADDDVETRARELAERGRDDQERVDTPFAWSEAAQEADGEEDDTDIGGYFEALLDWENRAGS